MRETSELIIGCCSRHVVYEDKKLKIEKGQLTSYCEDLPPFLRRIFVKPKKFAWQCECRFARWIQEKNTNKVLAFLKDPIDLPILPIADIQPLNLN